MPKSTQAFRLLRIPKKGRKVAGVCAAWARFFGIDVTLVRIVWAFLLLPGGLPGIVPYVICWLVIPEEE